jgi:hypothetical protein
MGKIKILVIIVFVLFLAVFWANLFGNKKILATSPETFGASGTFTAPVGIYSVTGVCRGGGAGGSLGGTTVDRAGGGGGGGAYAKKNSIAVTPNTAYSVSVGSSVPAQTAGIGSSFVGDSSQTVKAAGGLTTTDRNGGGGGATANSVGDTLFSGGDGGTATTQTGYGAGGGGEGGRSNATGGAGAANSKTVGGAGGTGGDGGDGGKGGNNAASGANGLAPGGGGGGAGASNDVGGSGAAGQCVITYTDTWAPSVNQTTYTNTWTFALAPTNISTSEIGMTATTGYDYTGSIKYLFTLDNSICSVGHSGAGGTSSIWQTNTSYNDIGLNINKCYGYKVTASDSVGTTNVGTISVGVTTYTSANIPGTPVLSGPTVTTLSLTNDANSNPTVSPVTYYAVTVSSASNGDSTWLGKWVDASGNPSVGAVWMTDAALDVLVINGLDPGVTYGVKVKARNETGSETALSSEGQNTTTAAIISISIITDKTVNYGILDFGGSKSTIQTLDTQTVKNEGNMAEDLTIKTTNAIGGVGWTLGAAVGTNVYVHEFSINAGVGWTKFVIPDSYQAMVSNIGVSATQIFDLRLTAPNLSDAILKAISITIMASQH